MKPEERSEFDSNIAKLYDYLRKELSIKQSPKVQLVSDQKNADKMLGKTGYYDPDKRTIHLFITDRHAKDILRSFAHEVVHHWQHENEQLQTIATKGKQGEDPEYAQHDPWLRQMEKQAYLLGNILFRDWEDQKKAKDRESGKTENPIKEEFGDKRTVKIIRHGGNRSFYLDSTSTGWGYPVLASALRRAAQMGYTHYEINGATREIPSKYKTMMEKTMLIGREYPPKDSGPEYKDS